jgi:hypothetical protein
MSDKIRRPDNAESAIIAYTGRLRWRSGILEQEISVRSIDRIGFKWEPVPTANESE